MQDVRRPRWPVILANLYNRQPVSGMKSSSSAPASARPLRTRDHVYLGLLRFFSSLPLGFLQSLGGALGWLAAQARKSRAAMVIRRNLELAYPGRDEQWYEEMATKNFIHTGKVMMEFAKTWGMPPDYSLQLIRQVHNEHLFHEALQEGRGTIAIVPHFGTWEVMNAWLSLHVAPVIMYKPGKDPGVDQFVLQARGRLKATMVSTDESGVKAIFKSLKRNGFTAVLPDHVPETSGGIMAPFFGIRTQTGTMVPKLIQRTGARAVMMYCMRVQGGFDIFFEAPDPDIYNEDLAMATAAMNRSVESVVSVDPVQYQWSYKRFQENESLPDPYRNLA